MLKYKLLFLYVLYILIKNDFVVREYTHYTTHCEGIDYLMPVYAEQVIIFEPILETLVILLSKLSKEYATNGFLPSVFSTEHEQYVIQSIQNEIAEFHSGCGTFEYPLKPLSEKYIEEFKVFESFIKKMVDTTTPEKTMAYLNCAILHVNNILRLLRKDSYGM